MDALYAENILDHYKYPRHSEPLPRADIHYHDANPLCGDEVDVYLAVTDGRITEIAAVTKGCAISKAAASLLTDELKGKPLRSVVDLQKGFVFDLLGVSLNPMRIKCALLGFVAFKKGIIRYLGLQEVVADDA